MKTRKQSITRVFSASNSSTQGNIFIGNLQSANNIHTLNQNHILAVVTVASGHKLPHSSEQLPDYLYLPALDRDNFNLTVYFTQTNSFIGKQLSHTNVLVHCAAGMSRSTTIVAAFLMGHLEKGSVQVLSLIKEKRPIVSPNPGFILQLKFYESLLKHERTNILIRKRLQATQRQNSTLVSRRVMTNNSELQLHQQRLQTNQSRVSRATSQSLSRPYINPLSSSSKRGQSTNYARTKTNLKLSSARKWFQKMVLANQKLGKTEAINKI